MLIPNKYNGYSADGRRLYYFGGGGGDSSPSPVQQQTSINELPEWARGYAKDTLAKTAALSSTPYQTYGGERIAGFQPMQQESFDAAKNMQTSGQLGLGSGLAGAAGIGALGTNYRAGRFSGGQFGGDEAQQYMNPYMQNVVDVQQREAQRQADIAGTQRGAQAVGAGAFGGSRQAIMDAEAARNLATQKGDIQAQGLNTAFQQAQNQFNADQARRMQAMQLGEQSRQYGAGLGMQGLQTALSAAGQLGQLGQTQFGQQKDIIGIQNQLGQQQQAQAQRPLDMAYQDFINQQNQPYKQLGFMSDMIRGLPLGNQATTQMYQAPPSALQTAGALGMGAYGLNKMGVFGADGGLMKSYADGGVTSQGNVESIINRLGPDQLKQARENALNRRDLETVAAIDARLAELAQTKSLSAGLGSAFDQIAPEQQEAMMAGGGIVAFAGGGTSDDDEDSSTPTDLTSLLGASEGNPMVYKQLTNAFPALMAQVAGAKYTPMTDEQYNESIKKRMAMLQDAGGPSATADIQAQIDKMRQESKEGLEQGKGLAALQAAGAMLQGNNAIRGIGAAGSAFGSAYGQALQADQAQKRSLANMQINLADSQRKEKMGLMRDAVAAADQARKDHDAAQQFGIKKAQALASVAGKFAQATKPMKGTGAGGPKPLKINEQLADAEIAFETNPSEANKQRVTALRRAVSQTKTSDVGPTKAGLTEQALTSKEDLEVQKDLDKFQYTPDYLNTPIEDRPAKMVQKRQELVGNLRRGTTPRQPTPKVRNTPSVSNWAAPQP